MRRATPAAYLAASTLVVAWFLAHYALTPALVNQLAFLPLVLLVMLVAWVWGVGPAIVTTVLGGLATIWLLLVPDGGPYLGRPNLIRVSLFLVISGVAIAMASWARRSQSATLRKAQQLEAALAEAHVATQALEQADGRKDQFLAVLAHELRNPLAPIRLAHELAQTAEDRETVTYAHRVMTRQLDILVRLVDDLLDVSRISRGKLPLHRERIRLSDVVSSAVETSRPLIDSRNHELVVALPDAPIWLDADAMRLCQAFSNLLNNAAKYTPPGGRIEIRAEDGDPAVITVTDTGDGIPPEALEQVFHMFMQVEARSQGRGCGSQLVVRLPTLAAADIHPAPPLRDHSIQPIVPAARMH